MLKAMAAAGLAHLYEGAVLFFYILSTNGISAQSTRLPLGQGYPVCIAYWIL
jgi:hypothetical protein